MNQNSKLISALREEADNWDNIGKTGLIRMLRQAADIIEKQDKMFSAMVKAVSESCDPPCQMDMTYHTDDWCEENCPDEQMEKCWVRYVTKKIEEAKNVCES